MTFSSLIMNLVLLCTQLIGRSFIINNEIPLQEPIV